MVSGNVLAILLWSSAALGRLLFMPRLLLRMIPSHQKKTMMTGIWDVSARFHVLAISPVLASRLGDV